jgi:hypothetical protein
MTKLYAAKAERMVEIAQREHSMLEIAGGMVELLQLSLKEVAALPAGHVLTLSVNPLIPEPTGLSCHPRLHARHPSISKFGHATPTQTSERYRAALMLTVPGAARHARNAQRCERGCVHGAALGCEHSRRRRR